MYILSKIVKCRYKGYGTHHLVLSDYFYSVDSPIRDRTFILPYNPKRIPKDSIIRPYVFNSIEEAEVAKIAYLNSPRNSLGYTVYDDIIVVDLETHLEEATVSILRGGHSTFQAIKELSDILEASKCMSIENVK